jgi:hypothetical protein
MDKVFVWISRINSVLLLLLLLGIGSVASWEMWRDMHRHGSQPVAVAADTGTPAPLTLGRVEPIAGSDVLMLPLEAKRARGKLTSGPSHGRDTYNALFLTGGGAQATWLFESNGKLIHSLHPLRQHIEGNRPGPSIVLYIEYTAADTNGDNEIDDDADTVTVALAKLDGTGRKDLLQNVKRVISSDLIDERTLALVYQIDKTIWHARYRTDTFAKLSEQPVIEVPDRL